MLLHLSIRDFAIVDRLELEFRTGFTVLTGETGAGKSILIDALSLTLGDRAGSEQVRSGAERADVSAEFAIDSLPGIADWLHEQALEGDPNRLLLRRVVDANGRSRAFVNGHAATINQMREAGDRLVDIHGQHAHQSLLRPEAQRLVLDAHAGLASLAQETGGAHREWQRLRSARLDHEKSRAARGGLAFRVGERRARRAVWSAFTAAPAHRIRWIAARYHCRARIGRSTVARSRLCAETLRRSHRARSEAPTGGRAAPRSGAQCSPQVSRSAGGAARASGFTSGPAEGSGNDRGSRSPRPPGAGCALTLRRACGTALGRAQKGRDETRPRGERRDEGTRDVRRAVRGGAALALA